MDTVSPRRPQFGIGSTACEDIASSGCTEHPASLVALDPSEVLVVDMEQYRKCLDTTEVKEMAKKLEALSACPAFMGWPHSRLSDLARASGGVSRRADQGNRAMNCNA